MTCGVAYTPEEVETGKKKILEYLGVTPGGTFYTGCSIAKIPSSLAYEWRKADVAFDDAVIRARATADDMGGDRAESKLQKAIEEENFPAISLYLRTKHKHRGYVERVEQNLGGQKDNPVQMSVLNSVDEEILDRYVRKKQGELYGPRPDAKPGSTGEQETL